ncbi:MAG: hypothetical protein AB1730_11295 [Myxococcota bacterium]|jgi:hypothetical protein
MKTKMTMVVAAVSAMTMLACGGGANAKVGGGKEGAAQALAAASAPTKASAERSAAPVDLTGDIDWACPHGGSAKLSGFQNVDLQGGDGVSVAQAFRVTYERCGLAQSDVGTATYSGTLDVTQKVEVGQGGVFIDQQLKGRLTIGGAFEDFLDTDVTQRVAVTALDGNGSVDMELKGSLANSSGSYTYDGPISVTEGSLPAVVGMGQN